MIEGVLGRGRKSLIVSLTVPFLSTLGTSVAERKKKLGNRTRTFREISSEYLTLWMRTTDAHSITLLHRLPAPWSRRGSALYTILRELKRRHWHQTPPLSGAIDHWYIQWTAIEMSFPRRGELTTNRQWVSWSRRVGSSEEWPYQCHAFSNFETLCTGKWGFGSFGSG